MGLMLTPAEIDRKIEAAEAEKRKKRTGHTTHIVIENLNKPSHAPTRIEPDPLPDDDDALAERRRERVQHEAEPYPDDVPEVVQADLDKAFRQAPDVAAGYPPMAPPPSADMFRRPLVSGHASPGVDYEPPSVSVHVPRGVLKASTVSRALITGGQSRPCAPGGAPC
jgi:hypothetical protein